MRKLLSVGAAAVLTIALGNAASPVAQAAPSNYTIELLPPIVGASSSKGYVINGAGDVAGIAFLHGKQPNLFWPAKTRSTPVLITLDGSAPLGISDTRVVVGQLWAENASYTWTDGKLVKGLGRDNGGPLAISANGTQLTVDARLVTSATSSTSLPRSGGGVVLGNNIWGASFISRNGNQVVGYSYQGSKSSSIRWSNRQLGALGDAAGTTRSELGAVNDQGVVVGAATEPQSRPVIWDYQGKPSFLPMAPTLQYQRPLAINNSGIIVGNAHLSDSRSNYSEHGLLWKDGKVHNLDDLVATPAGSKIIQAEGINDAGQIVGTIRLADQTLRGYVATPKKIDVYTTPGTHHVNGRDWKTTCEKYSQTTRCRTEIIATEVKLVNGKYTHVKGWTFNNLTYLPSPRTLWKGNPLGNKGEYTVAGRQWRTECDTPTTGRNGCRSYILATKIKATPKGAGTYTYTQSNEWVFNNIVMFK